MASLQRATLRQLRIFEAAARHLHFGRAAAELHLSQECSEPDCLMLH
jgi:hypothetical protein